MPNKARETLVRAIGTAVHNYREATDAFNDAACAYMGINRTDLRCAEVIARRGPIAASDLAEAAGLTRGAITTVLDRIEAAKIARRRPDPHDRRGVLVDLTEQGHKSIETLWGEYFRSLGSFYARYSEAELQTILEFLERACLTHQQQAERIKKLRKRSRRQ